MFPPVDLQLALKHGLSAEEYDRIIEILGRTPTYTELGIFSVMWSEHCSYKNSILELKKLPRSGKRMLAAAGEENAGVVDIGDGLAVVFKIESHNHPSAVEPHQGAATGVGGIMRDIFTMGARPVAALDSLRFGSMDDPGVRYSVRGIVRGIADYGNSFGVPTVAGEVYFNDCYRENPLVNVMAVGVVESGSITRAVAKGAGSLVMVVGSSTGRDGIHGATFASEELSGDSLSRRPSVQVGDPFTEKLLLEATLEVIRLGCVIGLQDMGAAGIACSTSEMSARGNSGMAIDVGRVPRREDGMTPYEVMLSESQERMLLVIPPDREADVREVFEKWDLRCAAIGRVTDDGMLTVSDRGDVVARIPAASLVLGGGAPAYSPPSSRPAYLHEINRLDMHSIREPVSYREVLLKLLQSPNICSRRWITEQYDRSVRTNTVRDADSDAAVIRLKGTSKALAMKTDCNPMYTYLDPYRGAQIAVAESARNVVCVGATPLAITNCLNFGNPNDPEVYWQFRECVRGIGDACRALDTPVTGGNVSFYNEGADHAVFPTPVIGMIGLIEDVSKVVTPSFKRKGDVIMVLGEALGDIGGSEYLHLWHRRIAGDAPALDLEAEKRLQQACLEMISHRLIQSAHDISEGGLAVALAECAIFSCTGRTAMGARVTMETGRRPDATLFAEDQSRIVISVRPGDTRKIYEVARRNTVPVSVIGEVIENQFSVGDLIDISVEEMARAYEGTLPAAVKGGNGYG